MAGKIFINYRRGDDPGFAQALFSRLEQAFPPQQVFMDVDNIEPGLNFVQVLKEQIEQCDVLISVVGKGWLEARHESGARRLDDPSDFVRIEIESALVQDKRVIPVLVGQAPMPRADQLPETLAPFALRNAVRLTHEHFRADVQGLVAAVQRALKSAEEERAETDALRQVKDEGPRAVDSRHPALPGRRELGLRHSEKPSIAVLPFRNMSADPEQEYFSDGISEDIITDLSKLSELHVTARNSSFVYKKTEVGVADIAKALGVRYLIEGSVRKSGDRVRVTATLIDATTGSNVWANRFDRALTDIFPLQDELTRAIVTELKLTVDEQHRLARGRAADIKAYEFLLRARHEMLKGTKSTNIAARAMAGAAIAIEPGYAAARAVIAFSHLNDYLNSFASDPQESLRAGLELAKRVVEMDAEDPAGHFVLGVAWTCSGELDQAEAHARRGLELSPNSTDLLILMASVQLYSGDPAGALVTLDATIQLDPHYPEVRLQYVAEAHFSLGEYEKAIAAIEQRLARNPRSETAYALLASCYGYLGRPGDGRRAWEQVLEIRPDFSMERRRRVLPFRNPQDFERRVEGLRKAELIV